MIYVNNIFLFCKYKTTYDIMPYKVILSIIIELVGIINCKKIPFHN